MGALECAPIAVAFLLRLFFISSTLVPGHPDICSPWSLEKNQPWLREKAFLSFEFVGLAAGLMAFGPL